MNGFYTQEISGLFIWQCSAVINDSCAQSEICYISYFSLANHKSDSHLWIQMITPFLAKRLQIELMSLMSDGDMAQAGISAFPDEDNLFRWVGTINGPQDSPYEGLILKLQLEFPETYPYKPPNCQFKVIT